MRVLQAPSLTLSSDMLDGGKKILHDAPEAQNALLENHKSLLEVSEYCYQNYIQSGNRSALALEETKKLTNQSLASVAYQINSLASSVLNLLDAQANQLLRLESSINLIGQAVEMHCEKVARREIGVFTSVQRVAHVHKILPPSPQPPRTYNRCPINYQQLDHLGHGAKLSGRPAKQTGTIRTLGSTLRSSRTAVIPLLGSLGPSEPEPAPGSSFRIGKLVAPPTVPPLPGTVPVQSPDSPGGIKALPPPPDPPEEVEVLPPPLDTPGGVEALPPPPDPPGEPEVLPPPLDSPSGVEVLPPPPDPPSEVETLPPPPDPPGEVEVLPPQTSPPSITEAHPQTADAAPPPPDTPEVSEAPPPPPDSPETASPAAVKVQTGSPNTRGRPPRRTPLSTLSLRVPSGSARHRCQTRSLFLPSLIIPPPPSYPAPSVPSQPPPPPPQFCLPARLEHLDLEISTPCLLLVNEGSSDKTLPPSDPPSLLPH